MTETKMSRNGSGYYDPTAYTALSEIAKSGEIWTWQKRGGQEETYLILKNHGRFSTALRLFVEMPDNATTIYSEGGVPWYTDIRMLQYIYNSELKSCVAKTTEADYKAVICNISEFLSFDEFVPAENKKTPEREQIPHQENVNHPLHYQGKHECFDEMIALFGIDAVMDFCRCNVYKYRYRATMKNGAEDLKKAEWYMDKLMELEASEKDNEIRGFAANG